MAGRSESRNTKTVIITLMIHKVTHHLQPTNNSCGQTALAILLSHFGDDRKPEQIMEQIPVEVKEDGEPWGTIGQELASWCISQGYEVEMMSCDFQLLDLEWQHLTADEICDRIDAVKSTRDVPPLGKAWSARYLESYKKFIKSGGKFSIRPFIPKEVIVDWLKRGPIFVSVNMNVISNSGRDTDTTLRHSVKDDVNGKLTNHFIVVYGLDENDMLLISDPWYGKTTVSIEHLQSAIMASMMECDNHIFRIQKAKN